MKKFIMMLLAGTFITSIALNAQTTPATTIGEKTAVLKTAPVTDSSKKQSGNVPVKKVTSKKHKDVPVKPVAKKGGSTATSAVKK